MKATLEVIEKGVQTLHKGDDSFLSSVKKNTIFRNKSGRYKVLSVKREKNHRLIMVKKLK